MRIVRRSLTAAITLAIVLAGCSSSHTTRPASSRLTTTTHRGPVTATPSSATGITPEQLDAHLGVGVPAGWVPVDDGEARVWVPNDWVLAAGPQGLLCSSAAPGVIGLGSVPFAGCRSLLPSALPKQMIGIVPLSQTHHAQPSSTTHGYPIYNDTSPIRYSIAKNIYDVPQLDISIVSYGSFSSRVLNTLAPSARKVALAFANEAVPNGWHTVTEDGLSVSIPRSWAVITPIIFYCGGWPTDELVLIKAHLGLPSCPAEFVTPQTAANAFHEGITLYLTPDDPQAPIQNGNRIGVVEHGATTITVFDDRYEANALDLFVHRAGSKITHVLTLGLGRDGRVAGGVLASIRAVT